MLDQFFGRSPGTRNELAAAVRAAATENTLRACVAERAFERADQRFDGVGWKIDVAALAIGTKLKHEQLLCDG
jgi:hypothetical protein